MNTATRITFVLLLIPAGLLPMIDPEVMAQTKYQKPPKEISALLDTAPTPAISVSPSRQHALLLQGQTYPPIADLAQPMLKLAGERINPKNNCVHAPGRIVDLKLVSLADGATKTLTLPGDPHISSLRWSPDGKRFACTQVGASSVELWIGDVAEGKVRLVPGVKLNAAYGEPVQWMPGSKALLCQLVPGGRGQPPEKAIVPAGPKVMESTGKSSPVRTYQDLLQNEHDEELFEYYCTSQLAVLDLATQAVSPIGKAGVIESVDPSPDGKYLLVARHRKPYSYLLPTNYFPREVEIWDTQTKAADTLFSLPLADAVPIEGVPTGPRQFHWQPTSPATLIWVEALDGGDPKKKAAFRDELFKLSAPFKGPHVSWFRTEHRYFGLSWAANNLAFVRDYDRDRKWQRSFLVDYQVGEKSARLIWDQSIHEHYKDPGQLLTRTLPTGKRIVHQHQGKVFLVGKGSSPKGDFPFLDEMDLKTLKTHRLFQCTGECYEAPLALLAEDGSKVLTSHEAAASPPNYFIRALNMDKKTALTEFTDPAPQLRKIKKELVTYTRGDGVELSFTLYLPPDFKAGQRRPAVVWAYPREYTDAGTAGQVTGSPHRFTTLTGPSHLFFLLQGYVVLDGATMPVVGNPETANNTFINQIVSSAQAALDKADKMGVIDRDFVGVGGHSYGAFMTANLLAHSNLFRAGIARSGAYNRTLTPFGFQNERRTLWEAPESYITLSPFMHAHKIKEPLLLIHGEADNNSGTFYFQTERMYHAIKGNAGTVRFVSLPHESHGYRARESVEHTLYEMITWFDKHVKNAGPPRKE